MTHKTINSFKNFMRDLFLYSHHFKKYGLSKWNKEDIARMKRLAYNPYILIFDTPVQQKNAQKYIVDNF